MQAAGCIVHGLRGHVPAAVVHCSISGTPRLDTRTDTICNIHVYLHGEVLLSVCVVGLVSC